MSLSRWRPRGRRSRSQDRTFRSDCGRVSTCHLGVTFPAPRGPSCPGRLRVLRVGGHAAGRRREQAFHCFPLSSEWSLPQTSVSPGCSVPPHPRVPTRWASFSLKRFKANVLFRRAHRRLNSLRSAARSPCGVRADGSPPAPPPRAAPQAPVGRTDPQPGPADSPSWLIACFSVGTPLALLPFRVL